MSLDVSVAGIAEETATQEKRKRYLKQLVEIKIRSTGLSQLNAAGVGEDELVGGFVLDDQNQLTTISMRLSEYTIQHDDGGASVGAFGVILDPECETSQCLVLSYERDHTMLVGFVLVVRAKAHTCYD